MCSSPVLSRSWSPLRHEYWFGPPNTQCQRYFRGSFTVKCATKVKSVEQVPLVGFTVTETATGGGPVVAAGEVGSVDGLAVGVGAVEVEPRAWVGGSRTDRRAPRRARDRPPGRTCAVSGAAEPARPPMTARPAPVRAARARSVRAARARSVQAVRPGSG